MPRVDNDGRWLSIACRNFERTVRCTRARRKSEAFGKVSPNPVQFESRNVLDGESIMPSGSWLHFNSIAFPFSHAWKLACVMVIILTVCIGWARQLRSLLIKNKAYIFCLERSMHGVIYGDRLL